MLNKEFQEICEKIEELMINALKNSAHSFRTFSLASIDDKMPSLRTVVLRDFSIDNRFLDCHSDLRSPKVEELKKNNKFEVWALLHFPLCFPQCRLILGYLSCLPSL